MVDEVLVVSLLRSTVVSLLVVIAVSDVAGHISNALIMIACICYITRNHYINTVIAAFFRFFLTTRHL